MIRRIAGARSTSTCASSGWGATTRTSGTAGTALVRVVNEALRPSRWIGSVRSRVSVATLDSGPSTSSESGTIRTSYTA